MKNIYTFNKLIYKGNIDRDFYFYCCKQKINLYLYIFIHIFYFILGIFSEKMRIKYMTNYHKYLNKIKDVDKLADSFYEKKKKKINSWYMNHYSKDNTIISYSPSIIVKKFLTDEKLVAYEFTNNYEINTEKFEKDLSKLNKDYDNAYYIKLKDLFKFKSTNTYLYKTDTFIYFKDKKLINLLSKLKCIIPILLPILLLLISFTFTTVYLDTEIILSYFKDIRLLVLNILPIIIVMLIILFLTKRLWISFSITSILIFVMGIVNKTKLYYRDDVLKFEDLTLFKEAMIMTEKYDIIIRWYTVICIIFCIIVAIYLKKNFKKIKTKTRYCLLITVLLLITSGCLYKWIYTDKELYYSTGDTSIVNVWIATREHQIRGLIYPFIYSTTELKNAIPDGYDENETKKIIEKYEYDNIPEDKKVNIIAIMLEAYNDFSKFDSIEFTEDIYSDFHNIQKNSLSGNIIVDTFGGGTSNTERHFITGYTSFPSFRKKTYSYATYFKEQGYVTEAMHPIYGAFYNRNTVNLNMGFDNYWNYENKFSSISTAFLSDYQFLPYLTEGLKEANKNGNLYFNFSVTYQNHGPYPDTYNNNDFIKNKGYSDSAYNMFNNYLSGIQRTNGALKELVDELDSYEEPTVLVFFGDHNPYLGESNYAFKEMEINLNLEEKEGFENYYSIPYVIHANSAAKKVIGKKFVGTAPTVSPNFLMNVLFEYMGYEGNDYLKYTSNIKSKIDVINPIYYKENGEYVTPNNLQNSDLIKEFEMINYYYSHK